MYVACLLTLVVVEESERLLATTTVQSMTPVGAVAAAMPPPVHDQGILDSTANVKNDFNTSSLEPNIYHHIDDTSHLDTPSLSNSGPKKSSPLSTIAAPPRDACVVSSLERLPASVSVVDKSRVVVSWDAHTWCSCKDDEGAGADASTALTWKNRRQEQEIR